MVKYLCSRCRKEFESSEIRFSGHNKYTCVYCLGVKMQSVAKEKPGSEKPKEDMVEYSCSACGYSFKRKKSFAFNSCPYCAKQGTVSLKKKESADKIINESTDKRYDF